MDFIVNTFKVLTILTLANLDDAGLDGKLPDLETKFLGELGEASELLVLRHHDGLR
jgi:hypothetical protein